MQFWCNICFCKHKKHGSGWCGMSSIYYLYFIVSFNDGRMSSCFCILEKIMLFVKFASHVFYFKTIFLLQNWPEISTWSRRGWNDLLLFEMAETVEWNKNQIINFFCYLMLFVNSNLHVNMYIVLLNFYLKWST